MSAKSFIVVLFLMIVSGFCGAFLCYLFLNLDRFYENNSEVNVVEYNLPLDDENISMDEKSQNFEKEEQNLTNTPLELNNTLQTSTQSIFESKEKQRSQIANAHDEDILENPQIPQEHFISDMPPTILIPKESESQKTKPQTTKNKKETKENTKAKQSASKNKKDRLVKELSNKNFQIYIKNGEELSDYRLELLKDMFKPLYENIKDAKIKILITLFDNNNMSLKLQNLSLKNKKNKNPQDYINLTKKSINFHYQANEIDNFSNKNSLIDFIENYKNNSLIKLVKIKAYSDGKGSDFANYMLGLKRGTYLAHFFLNFSEEIEIVSFGKENYPKNARNSEEQRYQYRKVEISF
ncbi:hypothetical protein [Campylobacter sp. US33a]|uniref:hypothetical protein n=1 Tax=Campylobacter sp. US33a TaxID=2498120 RepID=UPI00106857A5|nr:hypothetical protein [Campylobacter sp. US33a]TEY01608.1 hypothetical protein ELQ16_07520 [Campylobacter sp. US33a]